MKLIGIIKNNSKLYMTKIFSRLMKFRVMKNEEGGKHFEA